MFLLTPALAGNRGPILSMELRDRELKDILRALGQEYGINIIVDDKVIGKVTVSLRNVPLWDAIDSLLKGKGYTYIKEDNIVRVVPLTEDEVFVTHTMNVKYIDPKDIEGIVKKVLSSKGDVGSDTRSNTIIIKDIPNNIKKAEALIKALDTLPAQVMIDARIVEVNKHTDKSIGIQWGGSFRSGDFSMAGNTGADNLAVNLPASLPGVSTTPFGAIKFGLLSGNLSLDLRLSAIEDSGQGRVLSNPRILTANNKKASISTGEKIRIPTTAGTTTVTGGTTTTGTEEIEALLKLEVTPKITPDGKVMLTIMTRKEEFDWSKTVENIPSKTTREAVTELTVNDSETLVIGGIFTTLDAESEKRVPLLSKIPGIGELFKKKDSLSQTKELLIFITPTIVKETKIQVQ